MFDEQEPQHPGTRGLRGWLSAVDGEDVGAVVSAAAFIAGLWLVLGVGLTLVIAGGLGLVWCLLLPVVAELRSKASRDVRR